MASFKTSIDHNFESMIIESVVICTDQLPEALVIQVLNSHSFDINVYLSWSQIASHFEANARWFLKPFFAFSLSEA